MNEADNKILSEVLRVISKKTLETGNDIGIVQYLEGKALIEAADRIDELDTAIRETLEDNLDLADGDNCTLIKLKKAMGL